MKLNLNNQQMRQQLLNFNQLFQDSLMVINSTRMKLNDPKLKDKKSAVASDLASDPSRLKSDTQTKFTRKQSQKISVEVISQQEDGQYQK